MKIKNLTRMALMLALLIVSAQLAIPIGPVAVTFQSLIVLIIGLSFPKKQAILTLVVYVLAGLIGLPVFAQAMGGPHSVFLPSFGFIFSFIPAVWLMAKLNEGNSKSTKKIYLFSILLGNSVIYLIGILYMSFILRVHLGNNFGLWKILSIGLFPFIPADIIKSILAIQIAKRLKKHIKK
ncbi:MAG: biotin transporter BioY [Atopostipes suicloacalis]|nr:biotin transporter BioY [Atopostipes suicloacalis]